MQIETIRLYQVTLPITGAGYQLSRGRLVKETVNTVVELVTDSGLSGWGESCPFGSNYLEGFSGGALAVLRELSPQLIGHDPRNIDVVNRVMDEALTGHIYAKAAIDIACWDVLGKATGLPLYQLLGGMANPAPFVRSSVNTAGGANLADGIKAKRAEGFRVLTLKVGDDVTADADLTRTVAEQAEPGERITADANGGWLLHDAMTYVHMIADVPGVLIEQPCASLSDCLAVAAEARQPVILDESIDDLEVLAGLLSRKQTACVNLKIERIGGITKTRQMRDLCLHAGCAMFVQEVGGTEISYAATTHLAHTIPEHLLLGATTMKVAKSLADGAPVMKDGRVRGNNRPGLGLEIRSEALGDPVDTFQ
ncbi:MAG: mandelate racemase/muconate lactonizing enzyme family protein [Hyphomicrobiales bacterium]|nr:mandelate racemase/muconate lactonizing enzyme family protein [Hyphomicrobiales bacterium]